jgi:hypothetical protein
MTKWQDRAIELKRTCTWADTARQIHKEYFPQEDAHDIYERVRAHLRRNFARSQNVTKQPQETVKNDSPDKLLSILKTGCELKDIAQHMGTSERVAKAMIDDLIEKGHCIDEDGDLYLMSTIPHMEPQTHEDSWKGEKIIRFGLLGDTQINSKYTQLTHLHTAYETFKREGIKIAYHTGDMDEGEQMRPGHQYECYCQGADDHVAEIVRVYPKEDGMETRYILGNHDFSFIKHIGYDIGKAISSERPDMKYLGQSQAFVKLTPNCILEMRHPGDGTAYAISYKIQKMVEAMSGGEKPNILAIGHYHKSEYLFYRNVHCIQTACLQAQTPWMRGKGIAAAMGFYIVEIDVDDVGTITRLKQEFFPFYKAIVDDWKNYR